MLCDAIIGLYYSCSADHYIYALRYLIYMEALHCFDHNDQPAIAYCQQDNVLYCAQCLKKHNGHNIISDIKYKQFLNTQLHVFLLKETSAILAKAKLTIEDTFKAIEESLNYQCSQLLKSQVDRGNQFK